MLTKRDIKIRYKQSLMGFAWAILMPVLVVGSGLIVMVAFAAMSGKPINKLDVLPWPSSLSPGLSLLLPSALPPTAW